MCCECRQPVKRVSQIQQLLTQMTAPTSRYCCWIFPMLLHCLLKTEDTILLSISSLLMFTIHTHQCPDYLADSVHPYSNNDPARYRLHSATGTNYSVPRTRTKFGVMWNSLPAAVRHAHSLHSFKRRLKSYFFSLRFNDWQCNAPQVLFRAWRALNSHFYSILLCTTYEQVPYTAKVKYVSGGWNFTWKIDVGDMSLTWISFLKLCCWKCTF